MARLRYVKDMDKVQQRSIRNRVLGALIFVPSFMLMVGYCQLWAGERGVPLAVSIEWAARTMVAWAAFGGGLWLLRGFLARRIERGRPEDLTEATGAIFLVGSLVVLASTAISFIGAGHALEVQALARRVLQLSPVLALVAGGLTAVAMAVRWRRISVAAQPKADVGGEEQPGPAPVRPEWIELPEAPRLRLRRDEVSVIRTARNYCEIPLAGREVLVRITAKQLEDRLAPHGFARVHRSAIVNLARVAAVEEKAGRSLLLLDDGSRLVVSRSYRQGIEQRLSASTTRH